jgi:predicted negative regulator of RcsB-dependent stress response
MSIKDNVDFIKNEISNEEKFLEGFVKTERFFKKYKTVLISGFIVLAIIVIGFVVNNSLETKNKYESNLLLSSYLENKDANILNELKEKNEKLYQVAVYLDSQNSGEYSANISLPVLKELLEFQKAMKEQNIESLNSLSLQNDFLLKDYAIFTKALALANEGKFQEAKDAISTISKDSKSYELANLLNHYLLTK